MPLRVGVLGVGFAGAMHARSALAIDGAQVVAVAAVPLDEAATLARECGARVASAEEICAACGTSLGNLVRAHHFVGDLAVVYPALRIWQEKLAGAPIPFAALRTPALPIPGTDVIVDMWVYRPGR